MTDTHNKSRSPFIIIFFVGAFIIFLVWSAFQAAGLGSKVTDREYYSKGLKYNTTMVEKRAAEVLGWKLETRLVDNVIEFHLRDQEGKAVVRATGALYLAIPDTAENIRLPLKEMDSGFYMVSFTDTIKGAIQARLELERDGARLNRQLLLNL